MNFMVKLNLFLAGLNIAAFCFTGSGFSLVMGFFCASVAVVTADLK